MGRHSMFNARVSPSPACSSSACKATARAESRFAGCTRAGSIRKASTVEVVLQALQQPGNLTGLVHVGLPLADHTVFVDDNCGPFPV